MRDRPPGALDVRRDLWRIVQTVVVLTKNQRQREDPVYAELLSRVRVGECKALPVEKNRPSDVDILYKRVAHRVFQQQPEALRGFADAPVIVGTKSLRDTINARRAYHHAASMGQELHLYHSKDRMNRAPVPARLRKPLWGIGSSKTQDALGQLPLFPGMRVMVLENLAFSRGLVNGAEGTVEEVLWEEHDGYRYATAAYVRVPGSGQVCADR